MGVRIDMDDELLLRPSVWDCKKEVSDPVIEETDFFTYIYRLFIAIVTCTIWTEGLPQKRIYHVITETFTCKTAGYTPIDIQLVLAYLTAHFGYPKVQPQVDGQTWPFTITAKRTTANWVEPCRLQISYNNTVVFDQQRQVTSTLTDDIVQLRMPISANYAMMMRPGAEFVLCQDRLAGKKDPNGYNPGAENPAILRYMQLQEACTWLGMDKKSHLGDAISVQVNRLFHFYPDNSRTKTTALDGIQHAGRWVVRLKEEAGGRKSMEVALKVVGPLDNVHLGDISLAADDARKVVIQEFISREQSEVYYKITLA